MKTIITVAAATLVFAFTAHAGELDGSIPANRQLARTCATNSHWLQKAVYTPGKATKCAQFLATGNVLQIHHWTHT